MIRRLPSRRHMSCEFAVLIFHNPPPRYLANSIGESPYPQTNCYSANLSRKMSPSAKGSKAEDAQDGLPPGLSRQPPIQLALRRDQRPAVFWQKAKLCRSMDKRLVLGNSDRLIPRYIRVDSNRRKKLEAFDALKSISLFERAMGRFGIVRDEPAARAMALIRTKDADLRLLASGETRCSDHLELCIHFGSVEASDKYDLRRKAGDS